MTRKALALAIAALLIAIVGGTSRARAAGGTFRVIAGGDQNWAPQSGGIDRTSNDPLDVTGTLVGTLGAVGTVDYHVASGPGIVRAKMNGQVTVPSGDFYPFDPSLQAVSSTELTVSGPPVGGVNVSLNLHVDGILATPLCGTPDPCGDLRVNILSPRGQSEFATADAGRINELGLAADPVPGGFHIHGDVVSQPFSLPVNTPNAITIVLNISGRFAGRPAPSTFFADFDDPVVGRQVSFSPTLPVLNGIPAGYTVTGPNVVDNHWTNPFAPPSGDVVVTNCADPALAGLTTVSGSLIFRNLTGCPEIALPNLREVHGDLIVENNPDLTHVRFTGPVVVDGSVRIVNNDAAGGIEVHGATVSGDLVISGNDVGGAIDVSGTGGDLTIDDNSVGGAIDVSGTSGDLDISQNSVGEAVDASGTGGDLTIDGNLGADAIDVSGNTGGDLTIVDNGATVVNAAGSTGVGGNADISTGGSTVSAVTADGTTEVTMLNGAASLHAVLPAGAFDKSVGFSIAYRLDDPPEGGTAADGAAAVVDPIATYQFAFDVPTLNSPAKLSFTVDMSQLDAAGRADLLNALASGAATIVGKGDAAGSAYAAFPVCTGSQTPACVAIATLAADGTPTTGNPAFVRFDGVVGHFSSYAVATVVQPRDTTPPILSVPADIAVDATRPTGAVVTYAASASDDRDPSPQLVCSPSSGTVLAIGTTRVTCTATDAAGNAAQASFLVHVRGAGEQIVRLIDKTLAYLEQPALRLAFRSQLQAAADAFAAKRPQSACLALDLYVAVVRLAPAKALTQAEKTDLIADAMRIKAVIGCR